MKATKQVFSQSLAYYCECDAELKALQKAEKILQDLVESVSISPVLKDLKKIVSFQKIETKIATIQSNILEKRTEIEAIYDEYPSIDSLPYVVYHLCLEKNISMNELARNTTFSQEDIRIFMKSGFLTRRNYFSLNKYLNIPYREEYARYCPQLR